MEYHSALKRKEVLPHATTWVNLKNIMLNLRSQAQKTTLYELARKDNFIETERLVVARG